MNNIYIIYIFLISFGIGIFKYNLKKITNIIKNRNLKYNLIQQDDDNQYKLFNTDEFELNNYIDDNKSISDTDRIDNKYESDNNYKSYHNQDYIENSLGQTVSTILTEDLYMNNTLFNSEITNNSYTTASSVLNTSNINNDVNNDVNNNNINNDVINNDVINNDINNDNDNHNRVKITDSIIKNESNDNLEKSLFLSFSYN